MAVDLLRIDPLYSSQPWPQCEGETFTSEALLNESGIPFSTEVGSDLNLESFQYAQNQIEQWVTGTEPQETQGAGLVVNEEFICYGMVRYIYTSMNCSNRVRFRTRHHVLTSIIDLSSSGKTTWRYGPAGQ
jgi:hypothetical protein